MACRWEAFDQRSANALEVAGLPWAVARAAAGRCLLGFGPRSSAAGRGESFALAEYVWVARYHPADDQLRFAM